MLVAKSKTAVESVSEDLTSITGITEASAEIRFALASSATVKALAVIMLSITLVIKASVSISTLREVAAYSVSVSSAIALK